MIMEQWPIIPSDTDHYSNVTWESRRLRSPATWVFIQQFIRDNIKETSENRITGRLWRESTGERWIPLTKGQ